jgi:hypothetical protein
VCWYNSTNSDADKNKSQVYTVNFGGKPPAGNIIDIPTEDIPEFDLLTAGFPCQVLIVPILLLVIATASHTL